MLRKIQSFLLAMVIGTLTIMVPASAYSDNITEQEMRQYLEQKNLPAKYLDLLEEERVEYIYNAIKNEGLEYTVKTVTTYLKETGEGIVPTSDISEAHMKLDVSVADIWNSTTKRVTKVDVLVTYEWLNGRPMLRNTDAISVNWNADVYTYKGPFESKEYANITTKDDMYYSVGRPTEQEQGGLGYFIHLGETYDPINNLPCGNVHGKGSFILEPASPLYHVPEDEADEATLSTSINVNYVHNEDLTGFFPLSFSIKGVNVSVDTSGSHTEAAASCIMYYN